MIGFWLLIGGPVPHAVTTSSASQDPAPVSAQVRIAGQRSCANDADVVSEELELAVLYTNRSASPLLIRPHTSYVASLALASSSLAETFKVSFDRFDAVSADEAGAETTSLFPGETLRANVPASIEVQRRPGKAIPGLVQPGAYTAVLHLALEILSPAADDRTPAAWRTVAAPPLEIAIASPFILENCR